MRGDTVHFDIIDRDGNMVSATPSGGWLQSSPMIPELGFCLGTRAQQFWLDEGHPAALAPGKRPRTTLTPTMALRDGEPYLAWGSPGGDQQDQWTAQFFLRHVHADEPAGGDRRAGLALRAFPVVVLAARGAPRRARGRGPAAGGDTIKELRRRGHVVEVGPDWSEGRLTAASQRRPPPQGRRQSARHAGLRGGQVSERVRSLTVLILRGARSALLEGWRHVLSLWPSFETRPRKSAMADLRNRCRCRVDPTSVGAPQDED